MERSDSMQSEDVLRRKIRSARDLHVIVRTMKTLSAVNIRHFEQAVKSIDEFFGTVERGLQVLLVDGALEMLPLRPESGGRICVIILGSDQGLCGGFNDHVVSFFLQKYSERPEDAKVLCIGSRAHAMLEERGFPVRDTFPVPGSLSGITVLLQDLLLRVFGLQEEEGLEQVLLFHNHPLSNVSYEPRVEKILPLDREWFRSLASRDWPSRRLPTHTMARKELFSALIRQYVFTVVARAIAESMASENAARLASMQAAEKNIEERLSSLDALYRSRRQDAITAELLDIVSGFEVLQGEGTSP